MTRNALKKVETEDPVKFRHNIGQIHQIDIMRRIEACYTSYSIETKNVALNRSCFQGLNLRIQYMDIHPT